MIQEEKQLSIEDLSARLPHGVIVDIKYNKEHGSSDRLRICDEGHSVLNTDILGLYIQDEIYIKPYLRPLSSMTEEEKRDLVEHYKFYYDECSEGISNGIYSAQFNRTVYQMVYENDIEDITKWMDTHYFAWRTLNGNDMFELGLAIKAPEGMYNFK